VVLFFSVVATTVTSAPEISASIVALIAVSIVIVIIVVILITVCYRLKHRQGNISTSRQGVYGDTDTVYH